VGAWFEKPVKNRSIFMKTGDRSASKPADEYDFFLKNEKNLKKARADFKIFDENRIKKI
jgi:hypothetical protein